MSVHFREVDLNVQNLLNNFINSCYPEPNSATDWKKYYEFIIAAFSVERANRPSVSQLADIFREKGMNYPGQLAVLYAHGLYVLALSDNQLIYGENFNP